MHGSYIVSTEGHSAAGKSSMQRFLVGTLKQKGMIATYIDAESLFPSFVLENPDDMYEIYGRTPSGDGKKFLLETHYVASPKKRYEFISWARDQYEKTVLQIKDSLEKGKAIPKYSDSIVNQTPYPDIILTELATISESKELWNKALYRLRIIAPIYKRIENQGYRNLDRDNATTDQVQLALSKSIAYGKSVENARADMDIYNMGSKENFETQITLASHAIIQKLNLEKSK